MVVLMGGSVAALAVLQDAKSRSRINVYRIIIVVSVVFAIYKESADQDKYNEQRET